MAYVRFSETSSWYIYWATTTSLAKNKQKLSIWRAQDNDDPVIVEHEYAVLKKLLRAPSVDWSAVHPNWEEGTETLKSAIDRWMAAVERRYPERKQ